MLGGRKQSHQHTKNLRSAPNWRRGWGLILREKSSRATPILSTKCRELSPETRAVDGGLAWEQTDGKKGWRRSFQCITGEGIHSAQPGPCPFPKLCWSWGGHQQSFPSGYSRKWVMKPLTSKARGSYIHTSLAASLPSSMGAKSGSFSTMLEIDEPLCLEPAPARGHQTLQTQNGPLWKPTLRRDASGLVFPLRRRSLIPPRSFPYNQNTLHSTTNR